MEPYIQRSDPLQQWERDLLNYGVNTVEEDIQRAQAHLARAQEEIIHAVIIKVRIGQMTEADAAKRIKAFYDFTSR